MNMKYFLLAFAAPLLAHGQSVTDLFYDVSDTHPNADAIIYVQQTGIVEGYPDGTFQANATINRAEFTKILIGSRTTTEELSACDTSNIGLSDVPADAWFAPYICVAQETGLVQGYADGTFGPAQTINFAEAAKILTADTTKKSEDGPWYAAFVRSLAAQNAIPTSITGVDAALTRGEMAEMIMRLSAGIDTKESLAYIDLVTETNPAPAAEAQDVTLGIEGETAIDTDMNLAAEEATEIFALFEADMTALEAEIDALIIEVKTENEEENKETEDTPDPLSDALSTEKKTTPAVYIDYTQEAFAQAQSSGAPFMLFFHADWCPTCVALAKDLQTNLGDLPNGSIVLQVNYDTTDLRSEYGVTMQHTGVFFDAEGQHVLTEQGVDLKDIIRQLEG